MFKSLFFLLSCGWLLSHTQVVPHDSVILLRIYSHVDIGGLTYTRKATETETQGFGKQTVSYQVKFKAFVNIQGQQHLVVICHALVGYMGHAFGLLDYYLLQKQTKGWKAVYASKEEEPQPMGDVMDWHIITIGKNKSALLSTFESTANHHYEKSIGLSLITLQGFKDLWGQEFGYSNEAWVDTADVPVDEECPINSYTCTMELVKNNVEWYDIKVIKSTQTYLKGCKGIASEQKGQQLYVFDKGAYREKLP